MNHQPRELTIKELITRLGQPLGLAWIDSGADPGIIIHPGRPQWSGLALVSHFNPIRLTQVQVLEPRDLAQLDPSTMAQAVGSGDIVLLIFAAGSRPGPDLLALARQRRIAILRSPMPATALVETLRHYLARRLAPRTTLHGVFTALLDVGVLLTGGSGVGKSELALDLINCGHRLVADDVVEIRRTAPDRLEGHCPPVLRDYLEVRGLGLLNIRELFGSAATLPAKRLDVILRMEALTDQHLRRTDRLKITRQSRLILGLEIEELLMLVAPGRNLAVLVEAAVRDLIVRHKGRDPVKDFLTRQQAFVDRDGAARRDRE